MADIKMTIDRRRVLVEFNVYTTQDTPTLYERTKKDQERRCSKCGDKLFWFSDVGEITNIYAATYKGDNIHDSEFFDGGIFPFPVEDLLNEDFKKRLLEGDLKEIFSKKAKRRTSQLFWEDDKYGVCDNCS